ncbi:hypothetical protein OZX69_05935 [Lactobacillus sp. ESL0731]|uniref:hypothetical protein n=1 Tax=unclassified Lactobacillus TaxID=2620435 RepID=UPI0023F98676|nr:MULTISPECIES: hypothetical protein [unclassified Lactobacillus]WEV50502.1 hypothetical protein OZX63_05930 [Lactobacillus sp. ESL0700]WEV61632.1 hypothetical protein OZX69_05935 [Lactobacillus sp. ESL0731]
MFENKLSTTTAERLFALVQIIIGLIGFFCSKAEIKVRYIFLIIFSVFGILLFIASFSKRTDNIQTVEKVKITREQKWKQILGCIMVIIALFNMYAVQDVVIGLILLDFGIELLIMPSRANDKRKD